MIDPEQIEKVGCSVLFNFPLGLEIPVIDDGITTKVLLYGLCDDSGPQIILKLIVDDRPVGSDNQDIGRAWNETDPV